VNGWGSDLQRSEYGMSFADDAHNDGALLHCFLRVFDLEDAALGRAVPLLVLFGIHVSTGLPLTR
jgi:hypothetical protein